MQFVLIKTDIFAPLHSCQNRRSLDLLSAALPPLDNLDRQFHSPSPPMHPRRTEISGGLRNYHVDQDQFMAGPLQEMVDAPLFALSLQFLLK
jgi:hypothetical protein